MASAKQSRVVDPDEVYTVTLNMPAANLSSIIENLPDDFTVEQAILFRLFRDTEPRGFNARHFREWCDAFEDALTGVRPVKVKKRERIDPIPPLAPLPPSASTAPSAKGVRKGRRNSAGKKR